MEKDVVYTIEDIAKELGVSKTTVSRAISGKGRIGKETRQRVLDFIEKHDYHPNVVARGLAQNKTYNIGMVLPVDYAATEFPFFKDCMTGIYEVASQYDYDILISMGDGSDLSQIHRMIINRKVDGMIISRTVVDSAVQRYLKEKKIPVVVIGPSDDEEILSVDNNNREASKELTAYLLDRGLHKLALIGGNQQHLVTGSRYEGYMDAHRERNMEEAAEKRIFLDVEHYIECKQAIEQIMESGADGIVCMDDVITTLTMGCLREKGIHVPKDIKVASMYDSIQMEHNMPSVTSLYFDTKELGRRAGKELLRILGEDVSEYCPEQNYQVIQRESTFL